LDFDAVALSFLFDKHYPIMEQLGLKDSSHDLQVNCAISYLFLSKFIDSCMCRKIRWFLGVSKQGLNVVHHEVCCLGTARKLL